MRRRSARSAGSRTSRPCPALAELFVAPGPVPPGVYEALLSLGSPAAGVFRDGLGSPDEQVRVSSAFGAATLLEPDAARPLLAGLLADEAGTVRAAAAELLGRIGGERVPEGLVRATRDEQRSVRRAAVAALASFDEPVSLRLAGEALDDPDRDTALLAGETLVRLSRRPVVGRDAAAAISSNDSWPLETARSVVAGGAMIAVFVFAVTVAIFSFFVVYTLVTLALIAFSLYERRRRSSSGAARYRPLPRPLRPGISVLSRRTTSSR